MTETTLSTSGAWGVGLATLSDDGRVLDTWYPTPALTDTAPKPARGPGTVHLELTTANELLGFDVTGALGPDSIRSVRRVAVLSYIDSLEDPPLDAHDVYLRLHLLSHRLIRPNEANLDGIFGTLNNVVWTTAGPCAVEGFEQTRLRILTARMTVQVLGIDKFPRMVDYVVPSGVRIADGDRVRLGAHLGEGTVVMQVGYINFNAGTLGTAMVEGRISQGTVVDEDSDLGAGSSLMGTLSGGGKEVVRLGKRCLIGANGGVGISLGDDCVVESGLYITAGTQVTLPDGQIVKAVELSGRDQLMFIRNSTTGVVEVRHREQNTVALNPDLHAND